MMPTKKNANGAIGAQYEIEHADGKSQISVRVCSAQIICVWRDERDKKTAFETIPNCVGFNAIQYKHTSCYAIPFFFSLPLSLNGLKCMANRDYMHTRSCSDERSNNTTYHKHAINHLSLYYSIRVQRTSVNVIRFEKKKTHRKYFSHMRAYVTHHICHACCSRSIISTITEPLFVIIAL